MAVASRHRGRTCVRAGVFRLPGKICMRAQHIIIYSLDCVFFVVSRYLCIRAFSICVCVMCVYETKMQLEQQNKHKHVAKKTMPFEKPLTIVQIQCRNDKIEKS